ncbi:MAG: methyltransferase domain-containing protein [Bryobacteraceae bacterium]
MVEFTGERIIPGQVEADLFNEHYSRYAFAQRFAQGKRVLDAGCGVGYGTAALARVASEAIGMDVTADAVDEAARSYKGLLNLRFLQGDCRALALPDAAFDLVVSFEVIEHLEDWPRFLSESRRVLSKDGCFIVSTPNRLYYTESRGNEPNPFHVHEFDYDEFRAELLKVYPYVKLLLQNHTHGIVFEASDESDRLDAAIDAGERLPEEAHFFIAVCSPCPLEPQASFVYVPGAGNLLRRRERHIALLQEELARKDEWLEKSKQDLATLYEKHRAAETERLKMNEELDARARWGFGLAEEVKRKDEELLRASAELETKCQELFQCVEILHDTERRAQDLFEQRNQLEDSLERNRVEWEIRRKELGDQRTRLAETLRLASDSRWLKLGRKFNLGPDFSDSLK